MALTPRVVSVVYGKDAGAWFIEGERGGLRRHPSFRDEGAGLAAEILAREFPGRLIVAERGEDKVWRAGPAELRNSHAARLAFSCDRCRRFDVYSPESLTPALNELTAHVAAKHGVVFDVMEV